MEILGKDISVDSQEKKTPVLPAKCNAVNISKNLDKN